MSRPIYTKIILLLSLFMLFSSANSQEHSRILSNLAHKMQSSVNKILFHHYHEEEEPRANPNAGPMTEFTTEDRFPELPSDLEAKLRAALWSENAQFRQKRKNNKSTTITKTTTQFKKKEDHVRTGSGLRGSHKNPAGNKHN